MEVICVDHTQGQSQEAQKASNSYYEIFVNLVKSGQVTIITTVISELADLKTFHSNHIVMGSTTVLTIDHLPLLPLQCTGIK